MKIVFFVRLYSPHVGGVEKHVSRISELLLKEGHDVIVITEQFDHSLPLVEKNGVTIYRIPVSSNGFWKKFVVWWWMLQRISLLRSADIIHAHDVYFWYMPFRIILPFKKSFVTFHGWEGIYPLSKTSKIIRGVSEKMAFGNICVGAFIRKWYGTKADFITYGGVDLGQRSKVKDQKSNKKLKIVFVGRLENDTGVEIYAQILEKLREFGTDFEFKAFGKGQSEEKLKKFGEVAFTKNPVSELAKADIVFSSSYLTILDALSLRKLVVSVYDNPLKKDYLEMSPMKEFIVIGNDAAKLAKEIKSGFSGVDMRRKLENGQKWAKEQTWEKVLEIYKKLWGIDPETEFRMT